jgi:hypothetical protein
MAIIPDWMKGNSDHHGDLPDDQAKDFAQVIKAGTIGGPGADQNMAADNTTKLIQYYSKNPGNHTHTEIQAVFDQDIAYYFPDLEIWLFWTRSGSAAGFSLATSFTRPLPKRFARCSPHPPELGSLRGALAFSTHRPPVRVRPYVRASCGWVGPRDPAPPRLRTLGYSHCFTWCCSKLCGGTASLSPPVSSATAAVRVVKNRPRVPSWK